jgi:hypothetical protein
VIAPAVVLRKFSKKASSLELSTLVDLGIVIGTRAASVMSSIISEDLMPADIPSHTDASNAGKQHGMFVIFGTHI